MPVTRREALLSAGALAAAGVLPAVQARSNKSKTESPIAEDSAKPVCLTDFEPLAKQRMSTPGLGVHQWRGGGRDDRQMEPGGVSENAAEAARAGGCIEIRYAGNTIWTTTWGSDSGGGHGVSPAGGAGGRGNDGPRGGGGGRDHGGEFILHDGGGGHRGSRQGAALVPAVRAD